MNEIPLIVVTYDRFDLLTGLMEKIDYPVMPYVINNSKNGNIGLSAAWNIGMKRALADGYEYAILSTDDVEPLPGTIKALIKGMKEHEALTIGTNSILVGRDTDFFFPRNGYKDGSEYTFFIANIKRFVDKIGFFDENFHPAFYEDNDIRYRIKISGEIQYTDTEIGLIHHGSATTSRTVSDDKWNELKEYYKNKWGGYPEEETWTHPYNDETKSIKYWHGGEHE
jgi:glycosyltransferase involved in cell wall biosynthesis